MGTHVFVVDRNSFPVHRDRFFCGVKNPKSEQTIFGLYADLFTLRIGDTALFYQMRIDEDKLDRGFRGIYQIVSEPFFDTTEIEGVPESMGVLGSAGKSVIGKCPHCGSSFSEERTTKKIPSPRSKSGQKEVDVKLCKMCNGEIPFEKTILPNRVLIKPLEYYDLPVDDNTAYIDRDDMKDAKKDILWTMIFRKVYGAGRERSITPVLPNEANKLIRLIRQKNNKEVKEFPPSKEYPKSYVGNKIQLQIKSKEDGSVVFESMLRAWIMQNIDKNKPVLKDIIGGDLEYFGNNVLYGIGGENVDVLGIHKKAGESLPYKATVIELKKDEIDEAAFEQIKDYTKWMSQLVFSDSTMANKIQPVLIGREIPSKIIKLVRTTKLKTQTPILAEYHVEKNTLKFEIKT